MNHPRWDCEQAGRDIMSNGPKSREEWSNDRAHPIFWDFLAHEMDANMALRMLLEEMLER